MRTLPLLLALLLTTTGAALAQSDAPTVILHGGDVFTADPDRPRAQAVAVRGDRIVAVGSDAEVLALADPSTTVLDLDGRLVVPGLNDAHVHVGPWPEMRGLGLNGQAEPAWATVLDSVRAAAPTVPAGTWLRGSLGGSALDDPAATRFALDAIAPDHPVLLAAWTGHGMVLNTAALRAVGLSETEPDRPGGWFGRVAGTDTLDGRLWEYPQLDVVRRLSDPLPRAEAVATYREFAERMVRWGVTSIQQMENDRPLAETLAALAEADVPLRWGIFAWPMPAERVDEPRPPVARPAGLPARVRVVGTKWMLDGTPVERGAALRQPYADRPGWSGRVNFTPAEVRTILQSALDRDEQTALHVVGDSTLALVLETMAELAPPEAWRARRVRIEHGEGAMPDLLPRMASLGMVLVQNPLHFAIPQVMAERYGEARVREVQLLRSAAEAGVPVALGADAGGSGRNPWLNLMMATLHPVNPAEALSREDALVAYTRGSAYAEGMEREKGTLAPGMLADLAVLSQDVLAVPPDALPATESVLTMVGGEIVHRAAAPTGTDTRAIEAAMARWFEAWETADAALAARDYADDAEWTNAFGQTQRGRAAIEAQLREVFARPFVTAGQSVPTDQTIRFLRPDVALVWTRVERRGQQTAGGEALGLRRTSHLRVFERRGGAWFIASHLISDARDTAAPQH